MEKEAQRLRVQYALGRFTFGQGQRPSKNSRKAKELVNRDVDITQNQLQLHVYIAATVYSYQVILTSDHESGPYVVLLAPLDISSELKRYVSIECPYKQ